MTFLYLNSDKMGNGDDALGKKLMISFLKELSNSSAQIDMVGCVNSAIYLTIKGSEVLDYFKRLEEGGARISSCKTCLKHYNKLDELAIGETGSMDQAVQIMSMADRVIQPN